MVQAPAPIRLNGRGSNGQETSEWFQIQTPVSRSETENQQPASPIGDPARSEADHGRKGEEDGEGFRERKRALIDRKGGSQRTDGRKKKDVAAKLECGFAQ